jgi:pimeloyl-ACP methyl ester carboxylesterase
LTVIYLHGFASGPSSRKAQFFRDRFREQGIELEVPDLAEGDFEGLTISKQLQLLQRLASGRPAALIGSSMGGYVAALYAARHPEVRKIVLLAPAFAFARRWAEYLGEAQMEGWRRSGRLFVYHYAAGRELPVGYRLMEDALEYEDFPAISQPALVFHGLHDPIVPPAFAREFAARHSGARLRLLESGHELLDVLQIIWEEVRLFVVG